MERIQSHSEGESGSRACTAGSFQSMECLKRKKPIIGRKEEEKKVEMGRKGKKHEKEKKRNVPSLAFPPSAAGGRSATTGHSCGWAEGKGLGYQSL